MSDKRKVGAIDVSISGDDLSVRIWKVNGGQAQALLKGHTGSAYSVAFSPNSRLIASGSLDGSVRLWVLKDSSS